MKRIILVILCATMLTAVFAACERSDNPSGSYWDQLTNSPSPDETTRPEGTSPTVSGGLEDQVQNIDFKTAFESFASDEIMVVIGDYTVTWAELFFSIHGVLNSLISSYGELPDLNGLTPDGTTYAESVINYAIENLLIYRAVEYGAKSTGVDFDEELKNDLQSGYEEIAESYGGMDEFLNILWEEDGISSFDIFYYLYSIPYLADVIFTELFGFDGSMLPDEEVAVQAMFGGYLMAKHILRLKTEEDEETPLQEAEDIHKLLDDYDGDDFDLYFDLLMNQHSEDTGGLSSFPNGYLFQYGDMVQPFYDACLALEIGEYSDVVETTYGYHIIYKLPINYDEIPMYNYSQYDFRSLRGVVAQSLFNDRLNGWISLLTPVHTAALESADLALIFNAA